MAVTESHGRLPSCSQRHCVGTAARAVAHGLGPPAYASMLELLPKPLHTCACALLPAPHAAVSLPWPTDGFNKFGSCAEGHDGGTAALAVTPSTCLAICVTCCILCLSARSHGLYPAARATTLEWTPWRPYTRVSCKHMPARIATALEVTSCHGPPAGIAGWPAGVHVPTIPSPALPAPLA